MDSEQLKQKLKEVIDPELGLNIIDLGLVYGIKVDSGRARITLTLTTPTCPLGAFILGNVEEKIREAGLEPEIDLTFDPPWTPDRMSPELKKRFGFK